jgi:hypothetical protein
VSSDQSLAVVQRAFAAVASALDGSSPDSLAGRLREDRGISAAERMAIYSHAYFARIHGALREDFGALAAALGEAAFHDLAKLYVMAHPPRTFSLRFAGEGLPRFLQSPVADVFRRRWPFAADLAALEWALADLFDAPDSPVLARESLAALAPADWGRLRLRFCDAHRVLTLDWPVTELREAWAASRPLPGLERRPTRVLVHRREERLFHRTLSDVETLALELAGAGASLESLCVAIADALGDDGSVEHTVALLGRWLSEHLLCGFDLA